MILYKKDRLFETRETVNIYCQHMKGVILDLRRKQECVYENERIFHKKTQKNGREH